MWYKPSCNEKSKNREEYNVMSKSQEAISELIGEQIKIDDIDTDFLSYYKSQVFCSWEELKKLNVSKLNVVIFSGYAGCGHFAPSKALAEKYSKEGQSVIVMDPLFLYSENAAILNCRSWEFMAKHWQTGWQLTRNIISTQLGTDIFYGDVKRMLEKERIISFLTEKNVDIVLSCYPYANTIMPEVGNNVKLSGIVVLDSSPIGFMNLPNNGEGAEKVVYFVPGESVVEEGRKMYPYTNRSRILNIYGTPCMFDKFPKKKDKMQNNICLFIPGSGLGIGKAIKAAPIVARSWKGTVIIVCGDNEKWIRKAQAVSLERTNVVVMGYVKYEVLRKLMLSSQVIVAKPGASMKEELAIIPGNNVVFGAILGQEVDNARSLSEEGRARWIESIGELESYLSENQRMNMEDNDYNKRYDKPFAVNIIYEETKKFLSK